MIERCCRLSAPLPFGAQYADGRTRFRIWAPGADRLSSNDVTIDGRGLIYLIDRVRARMAMAADVEPMRAASFSRRAGSCASPW